MNSNNTMDIFCGSTFWDSNLTWHTEDPELTPCFEKTVLVWTPCAFLWVLTLLEIYYIINSKERNIPRNLIGLSKLVFTILLIVVTLVDLGLSLHKAAQGESVYDVDYYTPIIKIATFILILNLLYYNKRYGIRVSGVQFFFWLLFLVASLPQLRREIVAHRESDNVYGFSSHLTLCLLVFINFLLNCFAEPAPKQTPYSEKKNPCPEVSSSFPSRLTYSWFDPLAMTGFRRPLVESDLWALNPEDSSAEAVPRFDKFWQKTLNKMESTNSPKASFRKASGSIDLGSAKDKKPASILPALCLAFGGQFIFGSFLKLINDVMMFLSPQLLRLLISFVEGGESLWKGYLYAVLLFMTATVQTMLLAHYFTRMYLVGMKIRTALTSAIYRKALKMSNASRKESTVGEIVNLMSVDAQRFLELTAYLNMIWSAPLQIFLALYFLWDLLGPSVLAGLAVMIVLIPVNGVIANRVKVLQIKQMKYKDERVKLMNEVLNGIKVLKMYAWEPSFEEQILKIRNKELHVLKQAAYLNSATSFIWSCAPFLVTLLTFATYVLSSPNNVLTPQKAFVALSLFLIMHLPLGLLPLVIVSVAEVSLVSFACFVLISDENVLDSKIAFVSLSLFNILRFPLSMLPMVISNIIQTSVAIKRLNKFMNCEELDQGSVSHDTSEANPIVIENGTFSWGEGEPTLKNINVSIPAGSLIAVVGTVGSGKSSLLSTFLGDMNKVSGRVNTLGSIAYVPQQAWIQNATLQDNILFGKSVDKARYKTVVDACALTPDLNMLPGGDQTEIGEKGINLSGGQKQRVSLARAVYYDTDIYFLDDPLSAVDSHVGKHIFEQVIGPSGLLKNKTRVLVTHGITYLPQADSIIVLKNGEVSEYGTYQQLLDKKGAFADFLLQHISEPGLQEESDINEIKQQLESKLGQEFQNKLQRARSLSESASESEQRSLSGERSVSVKRRSPEKTPDSIAMQKANNKLIEVEKTETGSVKWSVYKHYLISVGIVAAIVTIFMNLILQMFQIGSNYWLSLWAVDPNMVVNGTVNTQMRDMYLGVYGVLGLGQAFASFFADLMPYLGFWKAAKIMHAHLLNGILKCPLYFFETTPLGRVLARFSKDVDVLDTSLPQQIADCVFCVFEVVATLFVISKATPIFMAVILPVGILYYFIQRFYVATSRQLKRLESVSRSPIYSHFGETVTGAQTIRAYGVSERFILESESRVDHNQACYYPSCIANRWLAVRLEMIGNLIIFFAALFTVLGRYTINAGLVGLSVSYALQITQTLNWLVRMTSEVETNIVAVERIKEYAETQQEAAWEVDTGALPATWPHAGAVQLDSLVLTYGRGGTGSGGSETEPALKGVTCHIRAGEKIGIVGRTGAGKSTLTLGLFRIIEAAGGRILIDDVDISKIGLHQLRSRITIIPQDPVLFSGSLRMNLDPFNVYTDEELWRVLELAHLKAFVKGLAAGLEHAVSEGGENLSVGQRQLVCLARALLRKTPLLVLDEATAAVDLETDDLIQRTIRQEFASCTILTIAHRLNTIMDSSRVMVLDKGRLVEFAAPAELLQDKNTIFYSMAKDAGLVN